MLKLLLLLFAAALGLLFWGDQGPDWLREQPDTIFLVAAVLLFLLILRTIWRRARGMIADMND